MNVREITEREAKGREANISKVTIHITVVAVTWTGNQSLIPFPTLTHALLLIL